MNKIEGLIAAVFTPFHEDGSLNLDLIPSLVDKLHKDGVKGIFICGSNGEGPNMTTTERMKVAEAFIKASAKRLMVIVHVGHSSIAEAKILANHAALMGADAFSSVAAFYFKPLNVENLGDCMAAIAAAAKDLPFYYYHIPHLTGVGMDMIEFLQYTGPRIPNLAGIKYTATTLQEYQALLNFDNGRHDILFGLDELLLPALAVGAKAAIGSTYTFAAPLYLETISAFRRGDLELARIHHSYMVDIIRLLLKYPPIPAQKAIMKMLGFDMGPCRLPLTGFSAASYDKFYGELSEKNFFARLPATRQQLAL
jgi:N-acetylneuraminate lyase